MCHMRAWKVNPLIGSAGISAVPMEGACQSNCRYETKPGNYLLKQEMGPNIAGAIGTAVAAGTMLAMLK